MYQGCTVTKTSHLPIHYFLALLWDHPILHISTKRVNEFSVQQIFVLLLITIIASPIVLVFTACWVKYFLLSIFECELLWILVHSASICCFLLLLVMIIWCKWLISLFRKVWYYCMSYIVPFIVCPVVNS